MNKKNILSMPLWMLMFIPVLMEQWGDDREEALKCNTPQCMVDYAENFLMSSMRVAFYVNIDIKIAFLNTLKDKNLLCL